MKIVKLSSKSIEEFDIPKGKQTIAINRNEVIANNINDNYVIENQLDKKESETIRTYQNLKEREPFYSKAHPYRHIGLLKSDNETSTAVALSEKFVLCCFHGIKLNHEGHIKSTYFSPAYVNSPGYRKHPYGRFKIENAFYIGNSVKNKTKLSFNAVDFAVLELEDSLPKDHFFNFPQLHDFQIGFLDVTQWYHLGYPDNLPLGHEMPVLHKNIVVFDEGLHTYTDQLYAPIQGQLLYSKIQAQDGQSGGPLFQFIEANGLISLGIVGILSFSNSLMSGFTGFHRSFFMLIDYIRSMYPNTSDDLS